MARYTALYARRKVRWWGVHNLPAKQRSLLVIAVVQVGIHCLQYKTIQYNIAVLYYLDTMLDGMDHSMVQCSSSGSSGALITSVHTTTLDVHDASCVHTLVHCFSVLFGYNA